MRPTSSPRPAVLRVRTYADPPLVKALARAFRHERLPHEGRYASINEMAVEGRIERGCLGSLLRLTLLSPSLMEGLMEGRAEAASSLPKLLQLFPQLWELPEAGLVQ